MLADVYEELTNICIGYYGLNPCHYFSRPGLIWEAMLKMTDTKLDLVSDIDMYQFIEKRYEKDKGIVKLIIT